MCVRTCNNKHIYHVPGTYITSPEHTSRPRNIYHVPGTYITSPEHTSRNIYHIPKITSLKTSRPDILRVAESSRRALMQYHPQPPGPWGPGAQPAPTESISPIMMAVGQPVYAQMQSSETFSASFSQQPMGGPWMPSFSAHAGNSMHGAQPVMAMPLQGPQNHPLQPNTVPWNPPEPVKLPGEVVHNARTSTDSSTPVSEVGERTRFSDNRILLLVVAFLMLFQRQGRRMDQSRSKTEGRPGAYVKKSFDVPRKQLLDPQFM